MDCVSVASLGGGDAALITVDDAGGGDGETDRRENLETWTTRSSDPLVSSDRSVSADEEENDSVRLDMAAS